MGKSVLPGIVAVRCGVGFRTVWYLNSRLSLYGNGAWPRLSVACLRGPAFIRKNSVCRSARTGEAPLRRVHCLSGETENSLIRTVTAIVIGLAGGVFVWVAAPYNNLILGNAYISDDFLAPAAMFFMLVLVLGANTLLHRCAPGRALNMRQLAIILGMLLVSSIVPGQGLLRALPYSLAGSAVRVSTDRHLADAYKLLRLHPSLFPDPVRYGVETPASDAFLSELSPGQRIPWHAWIGPLFSWGGFLVPWWLMMTALAVIVLPQWRDRERLPFPLLQVQQALIETPGPGEVLPPLFRRRSFWIAAATVFLLHLLAGAKQYFPASVPAIPLSWDLSRCFAEEPLVYLPGFIKYNRIHFVFVGIAFFMRKRVGFSIWAFQILYGFYIMTKLAYFPPFSYQTIADQRIGAFIAIPIGVLWLGLSHFRHVLHYVIRGGGTKGLGDTG